MPNPRGELRQEMMHINDVLQRAPHMSIEELERHIRDRDTAAQQLQAEKGAIKPHLDRAWQKRIAATSGPSSLNQEVKLG